MPENENNPNGNEIVVAEVVGNNLPVAQDRQTVMANLMAQAGLPANLSNRDAINMVAGAIVAEVAQKPTGQLTVADAFALKAANAAVQAPTAGEEVQAVLRQAGIAE